jgi:hypothetical protein
VDYGVAFFMVGEVARLAIACIFVLAAIHAMRDWADFSGIVEQYRIAPRRLALAAARILPPLELVTAAALPLPMTSTLGALLGLCLMTLFTVAVAVNLARGRVSIDCGCGGASGQKLSTGLVIRNVVVMFGLFVALVAPARGVADGTTLIALSGASLALTVLYFAANQLMTNFQALGSLETRSSS